MPIRDLVIVNVLGFTQNAVSTINARFANRNPGWPVVTGLIAGIVFIVNWTFLIGYTESGKFMPLALLIPYTIATVAGGNLSAIVSMRLEKLLHLDADAHLVNCQPYVDATWHKTVLLITAVVCCAYLATSGYVLTLFKLEVHTIVLPFMLFTGTEFETLDLVALRRCTVLRP